MLALGACVMSPGIALYGAYPHLEKKISRRATQKAEDTAHRCGAADWATSQGKRKLNLAAEFVLSSDGCWSNRLLQWTPWFRCTPFRVVGHPINREGLVWGLSGAGPFSPGVLVAVCNDVTVSG